MQRLDIITRVRAWLWLSVWMPNWSRVCSWLALRRIPEGIRRRGETDRQWYEVRIKTAESTFAAVYGIIGPLLNRLEYKADRYDYQQSVELLFARMQSGTAPTGKVAADCEDYAGLAGYLFGVAGISGRIVTLVKRTPGTWRSLWHGAWEGHAMWLSDGGAWLVSNNNIYSSDSLHYAYRPDWVLNSWLNAGYIWMHEVKTSAIPTGGVK
jgi:hypothetical protein